MSGVFLRQGDTLVPLRETAYEAESVLQSLLEQHPEVLAGDPDDAQREWLLVSREVGIALGETQSSRGYIDHLFLDADGVPTLVEVKRSSDSRVRREVVGQMLDYASNARATWDAKALHGWFEARCATAGLDADSVLQKTFPGLEDLAGYWESVQTNLAADKLRLVFVADEIPSELRRIVEYLNRQMTETEVIAIEVRQYIDESGEHQMIVPRVLGRSEASRALKGQRSGSVKRPWTPERLRESIVERCGAPAGDVFRRLMEWADSRPEVTVLYGNGPKMGSWAPGLAGRAKLEQIYPVVVWSYGKFEIQFPALSRRAAFSDASGIEAIRSRFNAIPGVEIPEHPEQTRPAFDLALLAEPAVFAQFVETLEWVIDTHLAAVTE